MREREKEFVCVQSSFERTRERFKDLKYKTEREREREIEYPRERGERKRKIGMKASICFSLVKQTNVDGRGEREKEKTMVIFIRGETTIIWMIFF